MKKHFLVFICLVVLTTVAPAGKGRNLFPACYLVGGNMPGTPLFRVNVLVNAPTRTMSGHGEVTWTNNQPLELKAELKGGYVTVAFVKKSRKVVATLTGYPVAIWPPAAGLEPQQVPNSHLLMVLSSDWKSGTATFSFLDSVGKWQEIKDAPVKLVECF